MGTKNWALLFVAAFVVNKWVKKARQQRIDKTVPGIDGPADDALPPASGFTRAARPLLKTSPVGVLERVGMSQVDLGTRADQRVPAGAG